MSNPVNFSLISITDPNSKVDAKKKQMTVQINGQFSVSPRHLNKIVEAMDVTLQTYRDALDETATFETLPYGIIAKAFGRIEEAKALNMWMSLESGFAVEDKPLVAFLNAASEFVESTDSVLFLNMILNSMTGEEVKALSLDNAKTALSAVVNALDGEWLTSLQTEAVSRQAKNGVDSNGYVKLKGARKAKVATV